MPLTKEKITEFLKTVHDPELGRDIVTLGMVKEIGIDGGQVFVHLEVTSPNPVLGEKIKTLVTERLNAEKEIKAVTIQVSNASRQGPVFKPKVPLPGVQDRKSVV